MNKTTEFKKAVVMAFGRNPFEVPVVVGGVCALLTSGDLNETLVSPIGSSITVEDVWEAAFLALVSDESQAERGLKRLGGMQQKISVATEFVANHVGFKEFKRAIRGY